MNVTVKHRWLRPSAVFADGTRYRVRREGQGAFRIAGPGPEDGGRVLFYPWRDYASIERRDGLVEIQFKDERTEFDWDRHTYRLGDMLDGDIHIREEERLVVDGRVTVSGVRLRTLAPDLDPIIRELAFALALRSEHMNMLSPSGNRTSPRPF